MTSGKYRIEMFKNFYGDFYYQIKSHGWKILTSAFYGSKGEAMIEARRLAKILKCDIKFTDLEKDYE